MKKARNSRKKPMARISTGTGSFMALSVVALIGFNSCVEANMTNVPLLQLVLDLPELQQYYHVDSLPERSPLRLVCSDPACADASLEKFGAPVEVSPAAPEGDQPYLEITRFDQQASSAEVEFRYPVEGVVGRVSLSKTGDTWSVTEARLAE